MSHVRSVFLQILRCELLRLVRDKRALLAAIVFPMAVFPISFVLMGVAEEHSRETLELTRHAVGHDLSALDAELEARVLAILSEEQRALDLEAVERSGASLPEEGTVDPDQSRAFLGEHEVVVVARGGGERPSLYVFSEPTTDAGMTATRRVRWALADLLEEDRLEALFELVGEDPAARYHAEVQDLAEAQDRGGLLLGRFLPMIAVMILISGGSFAALGVFTGEREAGTLETLLVQPQSGRVLSAGKFAAVLLTALAALFANLASLVSCVLFGLAELPGWEAGAVSVGAGRLALAALLLVPTGLLLSAALTLISAKAKTNREGQHYLMPLTLVSMAPAALPLVPGLALNPFFALLPIAGPSLGLREVLRGGGEPFSLALAVAATLGWTLLLLRHLGATMDAERLLSSRDSEEERHQRRFSSRTSLRLGWTAVGAIVFLGAWMQARSTVWGLLLTFWVLVPALALLVARRAAPPGPLNWGRALHLSTRPRLAHLFGALGFSLGFTALVPALAEWQSGLLPMPSVDPEHAQLLALEALPTWGLVFLMALSPALFEELLFRGAILRGLRRDLGPIASVAWQALLFAAAHGMLQRLAPTFLLGLALGALTVRSRSLWPAVLLHLTYNGTIVLLDRTTGLESTAQWFLSNPWAPALALTLALVSLVVPGAPQGAVLDEGAPAAPAGTSTAR